MFAFEFRLEKKNKQTNKQKPIGKIAVVSYLSTSENSKARLIKKLKECI